MTNSSIYVNDSLAGPSNLRPRGSVGLRTDGVSSITWTRGSRGLFPMEGLAVYELDYLVLVRYDLHVLNPFDLSLLDVSSNSL